MVTGHCSEPYLCCYVKFGKTFQKVTVFPQQTQTRILVLDSKHLKNSTSNLIFLYFVFLNFGSSHSLYYLSILWENPPYGKYHLIICVNAKVLLQHNIVIRVTIYSNICECNVSLTSVLSLLELFF